MAKTEERKNGFGPWSGRVIWGVIPAVIVTGLVLYAAAWLISREKLPESMGDMSVYCAAFVGPIFGGLTAARRNRRSFVITGTAVGLVLFILRTILASLTGGGEIFGGFALKILAALLLGGFFGGLLAGKRRKVKRKNI